MMVVFLNCGANNSPKLGRLSLPASFFFCHWGDSGRKGRMRSNGIAGINPLISVYLHTAVSLLSGIFPRMPSNQSGITGSPPPVLEICERYP